MPSPNMSAIARKAGVGKATVSLALRNDPRLRPETRERIQEIARSMGYQANAVVSNLMAQLRAGRIPKFQSTIAILNASDTRDGLNICKTTRAFVNGMKNRCAVLGYETDEFWLHEPRLHAERLWQILQTRNIRGALLTGVTDHRRVSADFDILWKGLASVAVGIRPERPALHFACNDHYSTARRAAQELLRLGYRRPGLVLHPIIEEIVEYRFSSGLSSRKAFGKSSNEIPMLAYVPDAESAFRDWLKRHKPDVLVTIHPEIREWVERAGLQCPKTIGLVNLDITPDCDGWSGMNQNNEVVGALAVDLVVEQLHHNASGIPDWPKCMMTESHWIPGSTVRKLKPPIKRTKTPVKR